MAIQTLQNVSQFGNVPYEILYGIFSDRKNLSSYDLRALRAVCRGFKQLLDIFKLEPYNIWKQDIPPAFVFDEKCFKKADALGKAIEAGNNANNAYERALRKSKKFGNNKKDKKAQLLAMEKNLENAKRKVSKTAGKFSKAFQESMYRMHLSPSEVTKGNGWIKQKDYFLFLYRWLQKLSPAHLTQDPFVKESTNITYTSTIKRIFSKMIDEFANSKDGEYRSQIRCLLGYKEYEAMLHERHLQEKGGFENH
jgi:hypothetical protein